VAGAAGIVDTARTGDAGRLIRSSTTPQAKLAFHDKH